MAPPNDPNAATRILCDSGMDADKRAALLLPLVYDQLRAVAHAKMASERHDHTLQATALVHEAYIRLIGGREVPWKNRAHFYAAAAEAMHRILLDHARSKGRLKRGGKARKLALNVLDLAAEWSVEEITELDDAVRRLQAENPEAAEIVRLRFYAGMSLDDTSVALGIPKRTLDRRWEYIRTWLFRALGESGDGSPRSDEPETP